MAFIEFMKVFQDIGSQMFSEYQMLSRTILFMLLVVLRGMLIADYSAFGIEHQPNMQNY
jgi:hypothetical protein